MEIDHFIILVLIVGALVTIYGLFSDKLKWIFTGMVIFIAGVFLFFYYMLKM